LLLSWTQPLKFLFHVLAALQNFSAETVYHDENHGILQFLISIVIVASVAAAPERGILATDSLPDDSTPNLVTRLPNTAIIRCIALLYVGYFVYVFHTTSSSREHDMVDNKVSTHS
jgi:Ca2+/Na+ antiporter